LTPMACIIPLCEFGRANNGIDVGFMTCSNSHECSQASSSKDLEAENTHLKSRLQTQLGETLDFACVEKCVQLYHEMCKQACVQGGGRARVCKKYITRCIKEHTYTHTKMNLYHKQQWKEPLLGTLSPHILSLCACMLYVI
jgi:hypothetical protein